MKKDHEAEWKEWERRIRTIVDSVRDMPTVQTETFVPPIANHVPHLRMKWDPRKIAISPHGYQEALRR